jgi:5-(carboxyamino)imidazole ribonucleotide synthase
VLRALVADGVAVHPGPDALQFAQDKLACARASPSSAPQPEWAAVTDAAQLQAFLDANGGRAVVKTPRGGYDGKGVRVVSTRTRSPIGSTTVHCSRGSWTSRELAAGRPPPVRELVAYPVVETVQRGGVCAEVIAPAPHGARASPRSRRDRHRDRRGLGVTGMLAVELFETTMTAARQRARDAPAQQRALGPGRRRHGAVRAARACRARPAARRPSPRQPWAVMVNILGGPATDSLESRSRALAATRGKVHTYGKAPRPAARWATSTRPATTWMPWCTTRAPRRPSSRTEPARAVALRFFQVSP